MARGKAAAKAKVDSQASAMAVTPQRPEASSLLEEEEAHTRATQSMPAFKSKQLSESAKVAKVIKACLHACVHKHARTLPLPFSCAHLRKTNSVYFRRVYIITPSFIIVCTNAG